MFEIFGGVRFRSWCLHRDCFGFFTLDPFGPQKSKINRKDIKTSHTKRVGGHCLRFLGGSVFVPGACVGIVLGFLPLTLSDPKNQKLIENILKHLILKEWGVIV